MRRFYERFKTELYFFLLLALSSAVLAVWSENRPKDHVVQLIYAVVFLIFFIPTISLWRRLWREKLRDPLTAGIKKAFIGATRLIMRAIGRLPIFRARGNVLSGSTSVSYDLFSIAKNSKRRKKEKPPKPPRWKDMDTARKKLGYLYYRIITTHIKKGAAIRSTETPNEISERIEFAEPEQKIISLYKSTRYNGRVTLDEENITKLKEELFD